MSTPRVIPKKELHRQIGRIQKANPGISYEQALKINRREQLQPQRQLKAAAKIVNPILHKAGLGVNRGMYMETPLGIVDGQMTYRWGKQIRYAGIGQERSATHFDGEGGFTDRYNSDGLLTAVHYAHRHDLWDRPPGYYSHPRAGTYRLGDFTLTCAACGAFFSARKDSKTCSAKCRKRLSRKKTEVTLFETNK